MTKWIHGMSKTRFYGVWNDMMMRCYNPKKERYPSYGGRGIGVSKRWHVFNNFKEDMLASYSPGLSLDRKNVNKNYSKSNCRWIPLSEQQLNKRNTIRLTIDGETKTVPEWSKVHGITISNIYSRLERGWSPKDAVVGVVLKRIVFSKGQIKEMKRLSKNGSSARRIGLIFNTTHTTVLAYISQ